MKYFVLFTGNFYNEMSLVQNIFDKVNNLYAEALQDAINILANNDICFLYSNSLTNAEIDQLKLDYKFIQFNVSNTNFNSESINVIDDYTDNIEIKSLFDTIGRFIKKCMQSERIAIVTSGGSASSNFIDFLVNNGLSINQNLERSYGIKHSQPNSTTFKAYNPTKVIYVYGDLVETVRSFYRRNILSINYFYDAPNNYFNPIRNEQIRVPKFNSFQEYINEVIATNTEPLGIINHWNQWKAYPNVKFLNYADIPTDTTLDTFLGLQQGTCAKFKIKERWDRLDIETDQYISILNNIDATQRV